MTSFSLTSKKSYFILVITSLIINLFRIPSAAQNFWAEDGSVFFSDALSKNIFENVFSDSGRGGYLNLSGKLIGIIAEWFPIEFAPLINFILLNFALALIARIIFVTSSAYLKTTSFRIIVSLSVFFVPISIFDSLMTSINLHFFMLFAFLSSLIYKAKYHFEKSPFSVNFLIAITLLSDPFANLILALFLVTAFLSTDKYRLAMIKEVLKATAAFSVIQLVFMIFFKRVASVGVMESFSIKETSYLFLDRVIGSTVIPNWGQIDSNVLNSLDGSRVLIARAAAALFCMIFISVLFVWSLKAQEKLSRDRTLLMNPGVILVVSMFFYWFIGSFINNPEVRYAIFPSMCLLTIICISTESLLINSSISVDKDRFIRGLAVGLFLVTWVSSWHIDTFRISGPTWKQQIISSEEACKMEVAQSSRILILPDNTNRYVEVPCDRYKIPKS